MADRLRLLRSDLHQNSEWICMVHSRVCMLLIGVIGMAVVVHLLLLTLLLDQQAVSHKLLLQNIVFQGKSVEFEVPAKSDTRMIHEHLQQAVSARKLRNELDKDVNEFLDLKVSNTMNSKHIQDLQHSNLKQSKLKKVEEGERKNNTVVLKGSRFSREHLHNVGMIDLEDKKDLDNVQELSPQLLHLLQNGSSITIPSSVQSPEDVNEQTFDFTQKSLVKLARQRGIVSDGLKSGGRGRGSRRRQHKHQGRTRKAEHQGKTKEIELQGKANQTENQHKTKSRTHIQDLDESERTGGALDQGQLPVDSPDKVKMFHEQVEKFSETMKKVEHQHDRSIIWGYRPPWSRTKSDFTGQNPPLFLLNSGGHAGQKPVMIYQQKLHEKAVTGQDKPVMIDQQKLHEMAVTGQDKTVMINQQKLHDKAVTGQNKPVMIDQQKLHEKVVAGQDKSHNQTVTKSLERKIVKRSVMLEGETSQNLHDKVYMNRNSVLNKSQTMYSMESQQNLKWSDHEEENISGKGEANSVALNEKIGMLSHNIDKNTDKNRVAKITQIMSAQDSDLVNVGNMTRSSFNLSAKVMEYNIQQRQPEDWEAHDDMSQEHLIQVKTKKNRRAGIT